MLCMGKALLATQMALITKDPSAVAKRTDKGQRLTRMAIATEAPSKTTKSTGRVPCSTWTDHCRRVNGTRARCSDRH